MRIIPFRRFIRRKKNGIIKFENLDLHDINIFDDQTCDYESKINFFITNADNKSQIQCHVILVHLYTCMRLRD